MKTCSKCGIPKDESDFYSNKRTGKTHGWCKACHNADSKARAKADPKRHTARSKAWRDAHPGRASAISRAWQLRHPEKARNAQKKMLFNIDFNAMWEAQKGLCASCGKPMVLGGKKIDSVVVDHDRSCCPGKKSCGKCVRGLIHWGCNMILGYAKDDPQILRYAAEYVERHSRPGL